jgi:hypothetical protein
MPGAGAEQGAEGGEYGGGCGRRNCRGRAWRVAGVDNGFDRLEEADELFAPMSG